MTLLMTVCADCGVSYFPARLRCHRCGGYQFLDQAVYTARVSGVVPVHRVPEDCPWHCLVELQTEAGVTVTQRQIHCLGSGLACAVGCQ